VNVKNYIDWRISSEALVTEERSETSRKT